MVAELGAGLHLNKSKKRKKKKERKRLLTNKTQITFSQISIFQKNPTSFCNLMSITLITFNYFDNYTNYGQCYNVASLSGQLQQNHWARSDVIP